LDGCFRLQVFQMLEARDITFSALEELSLDGELLEAHALALLPHRCPRLRSLAVSFAAELDGPALAALASLNELEALTLKKAQKPLDNEWSGFFMQQGAHHYSFASWRLLNFCECELLSDGAALTLAASALPQLVELDLSWCWNLGDNGLGSLLDAAPGLERLRIAGLKNISAKSLVPCCRMSGLEELDCTACNSVSDTFLEFLLRLFAAPPGKGGDALPCEDHLSWCLRGLTAALWRRRRIWAKRPQIKNYYAQLLEDWSQLKPAVEVIAYAEPLLAEDAAKSCGLVG